jgi:hypothetical protein
VGNIIPVFFPIICCIIHHRAYLQETEFIITRHYVQWGQNTMPETELSTTRTNTLWPLYVREQITCHTVKVGVVAAA